MVRFIELCINILRYATSVILKGDELMENINKILLSILIILIIVLIASIGYIWANTEYNIENNQVDCYDEFHNKILGTVCIENTSNSELIADNITITIVALISIIVFIILIFKVAL